MKKNLILIFFLAFTLRFILSFGPYHPDLGNHLDWGVKFWQLGPKYFYENLFWQVSWANQPPGTIYLFAVMRKIYEAIFAILWQLNLKIPAFPSFIILILKEKLYVFLVKLPAILADLGIAYLIYLLAAKLKNRKKAILAVSIFLFNPVIWYNSAVWGQTDAIVNFFGLLAVYLFWREKPLWGMIVYLFSLYFKGSLLIFLPVFLIFLIKSKIAWWKKIAVLVIVPVLLAYLSFPFVRWMSPVPWLYHLYLDRIFGHQGNMLTANAFNLWALIFGIDFTRNDLGTFLGLTYKIWGQLLFVLVCLPVLVNLWLKKIRFKEVCWSLVIISFASFFFLTNMHERYLYPAFPFLTILVFAVDGFLPFYLILSLISFLNLYHLWYVPDILILRSIYIPLTIKIFSFFNLFFLVWFLLNFFRFFHPPRV